MVKAWPWRMLDSPVTPTAFAQYPSRQFGLKVSPCFAASFSKPKELLSGPE